MQNTAIWALVAVALSYCADAAAAPPDASQPSTAVGTAKAGSAKHPDRSGKSRKGKASYYAKKFAHKKMADGSPMNPHADVAASKTLPLGTTAQVTNLENGKSAVVEIRDRGPYEKGRIVDLSPKTAEKLDMTQQGVAQVEVKPLALPPPEAETKTEAKTENTTINKTESKTGKRGKTIEADRTPDKPAKPVN